MLTHTGEFTLSGPAGVPAPRSAPRPRWLLGGIALALVASATSWAALERRSAASPAIVAESTTPGVVMSLGRRLSHNGRYFAEAVVDRPIVTGLPQTWTFRLTRRNSRRVAHARVSAEAWMPETGEHAALHPAVRYIGRGEYRIDDLRLPSPGWWNLALVIDGLAGTDSVAFNVILPSSPRGHTP